MKKISLLLAALVFIAFSNLQAQDGANTGLNGGFVFGQWENGGSVSSDLSLGFRYWKNWIGGDFNLGYTSINLESTTPVVDQNMIVISGAVLLGHSIKENVKAFVSLGISREDASIFTGSELTFTAFNPSVGVDILLGSNMYLGFDLLRFSYLLDGEFEAATTSVELDGWSFGLLSGMRVGYHF